MTVPEVLALATATSQVLSTAPFGFAVLKPDGQAVASNGVFGPRPGIRQGWGDWLELRADRLAALLREVMNGERVSLEQAGTGSFQGRRVRVTLSIFEPDSGQQLLALYAQPLEYSSAGTSFRKLVELAPDGVMIRRGTVLLFVNAQAARLLGYAAPEELVGRTVFDLASAELAGGGHMQGLRAVGSDPMLEVLRTREGLPLRVEMTSASVPFEDGSATLMIFRKALADRSILEREDAIGPGAFSRAVRQTAQELHGLLGSLEQSLETARENVTVQTAAVLVGAGNTVRRATEITRGLEELAKSVGSGTRGPSIAGVDGSPAQPEASEKEASGAATVLVCDDEARLAMLTAGLLDQHGYRAVTVASGSEALAALARGAPTCDAVLLDLNLPDGTAGEVIAQMRERGFRQPVILTSGYAEEDVEPALLADELVAGYLAKPYSVDRLVEVIQLALRGGREGGPVRLG